MSGTGAMCVDARLQSPKATSAAEHDRRMKAKAEAAANDGAASGGDGPDMFEASGVAAE